MDIVAARSFVPRGVATREALLDAAETLIADFGFRAPSHRMIAGEAKVHAALVNYHFSSKELLFEAAIERRASRLSAAWQAALAGTCSRGKASVNDILEAWWTPFDAIVPDADRPWTRYLCVVARLASATDGETWHRRHFGAIDRAFQSAFAAALPGAGRDDVEAGFRYARSLFGEILLHRCGKAGGTCSPTGFRKGDVARLIRFLGAGMRGTSNRTTIIGV
jgi:AcrR family transcriptional regulator